MNKFISNILVGSICFTMAFGGYVKVPKNEKMKHKIEPAQTSHVNYFHGSTPIVMPNTRNSGSFAVVDSSTNGYGLVSQNTRPLHVDLDEGYWFTAYRQYVGELTTHGQIGAAFSEDGVEWDTYTNLNYNGNPPWGGGGVGGTGVAQGRYPSALGTEDQPVAIWNEYTADTSTGSLYGGRPYYAYDEFGWAGGSFSYPADIDLLWATSNKDLWVGSAAMSFDEDMDMFVVNTVYNDWTRGDRWLFHSEAYEDGFIVFGTEQLVIDEVNDLVGGDDTGSFNTSAYVSFNRDGLGAVGLVGYFLGGDTDVSETSNYHTGIFRLSDDHGASWSGCGDDPVNGCAVGASGLEYAFIPDSVFDDIVATQFMTSGDNGDGILTDECEGTTHVLDSFFTYYELDFKVDSEGNPHFVIQILPCESLETGFCWYTEEAGLYHFTADRDDLGNPDAWSWSFVMSGEQTWSFADMTGETYIWNNSSSLAFSADNPDVVYIATGMATAGAPGEIPDDPCYVTLMSDYPEWSEDLYVIKSEDGGATWWNPYNVSNTPDTSGGLCPGVGVTKCDPAETYPHTAQFGTDDELYLMYQSPNWAFNEIGDMLGADFMNRIYAGTVVLDDSDIPEYVFDDETTPSCNAPGDITGDSIVNVLDIVGIVNHILGSVLLDDTCAADYTGDSIVNVLDIVGVVNLILGGSARADLADTATIILSDSFIKLESDGLVQGVQLEINHGDDFEISLNEHYVSESYTSGNVTKLILVTNGLSSITDIASIKGEYKLVSSQAASADGMVTLTTTEVNDFSVSNAYPNPFNPSTSIELNLNKDSYVSVSVYNVAGQLVDQVFAGNLSSANHRFTWNAGFVSSGVYFMNIQVDDVLETKKLMLVK